MIIICFLLFVAAKVIGILDRRMNILKGWRSLWIEIGSIRLVSELKYIFRFMRHPITGCYEIKRKSVVSVKSANIFVLIFTVFFIINKYFCGFLMKTVREGQFDVVSDIVMIVVVLGLVVGCSYLVCTINDGEGKLKAIYCSFVYSVGPYFVLTPFIFMMSHAVTYNEVFFIQFAYFAMGVWIAVLMFISIKEVNNYSVKKTFQIIGLTLFTILIACLLAFIIYVLWSQVFDFLSSLIGEVVYKIGN